MMRLLEISAVFPYGVILELPHTSLHLRRERGEAQSVILIGI